MVSSVNVLFAFQIAQIRKTLCSYYRAFPSSPTVDVRRSFVRVFTSEFWIPRGKFCSRFRIGITLHSVIQTKKRQQQFFFFFSFYIHSSELLFVTSARDNFDNTGRTLTNPDSNVCINIEPGTFPDGKQQPILFHVFCNEMYVLQDIPETKERTLISPVIKCGPGDINRQKVMEIVVPHCL